MRSVDPDRLPVLTDVLEAGDPPAEAVANAVADDAWPGEAVAQQMRAQVRLAAQRLQVQLRDEMARRIDAELEARLRDLLEARLDALAAELAAAMRPALLDLAQAAVGAVLAPQAEPVPDPGEGYI